MSLEHKIVKNYSHALFSNVLDVSKKDKILEQISIFEDIIQNTPSVQNILFSPVIDFSTKAKILDLIATKCKFDDISKRFLYVLVKNARCYLLSDIIKFFGELVVEINGIKMAEVTSAYKLTKQEIKNIQGFLELKLDQKVELTENTEPSLIGGMMIKYDSNLIDCSVQGALDRIKKVATQSRM